MKWTSGLAIAATLTIVYVTVGHAYHQLRAEIMVQSAAREKVSPQSLEDIETAGDFYPDYAPYVDLRIDQEIILGRQIMAAYILRKMTALRPSWPYAWARLSHVLMQSGEYGEPLQQSLRATALYGAHDPILVDWMAREAILRWDRFDSPTKLILRDNLNRALEKNNRGVLAYAVDKNSEHVICEAVTSTKTISQWCTVVNDRNSACDPANKKPDSVQRCEQTKALLSHWPST